MNTSVGLAGMNQAVPANTAKPAFGGRLPATAKDSIHFGSHHDGGGTKRANPLARWTAVTWMMLGSLVGGGAVGTEAYSYYDGKVDQISQERTVLQDRVMSLKEALARYDMTQLASQVASANVTIEGRWEKASGTWIQDKDGNLYILTRNSVAKETNSIYYNKDSKYPPTFDVSLYNDSDLNDPVKVKAQVVHSSDEYGLALLAVSTPNFRLPENVNPVQFRDIGANPLEVGERVVAVGSPFDMKNTVTTGIISHTERKEGNNENLILVGTDAPMGNGSWGGALFDSEGRLIGIHYKNVSTFRGTADGLGFSVRADVIQKLLGEWGVEM